MPELSSEVGAQRSEALGFWDCSCLQTADVTLSACACAALQHGSLVSLPPRHLVTSPLQVCLLGSGEGGFKGLRAHFVDPAHVVYGVFLVGHSAVCAWPHVLFHIWFRICVSAQG